MEYDDSAFYYFSLMILTMILLPVTWSIVKSVVWGDFKIEDFPGGCQCVHCKAKVAVKQEMAYKNVFRGSFYFKLIVAAFFWYLWYQNASLVSRLEGLQSYDPFEVLGLDADATIRDIKKQYRKLSLSMHPDKNPDNPLAVQEFIRLTKAYNVSCDYAFEQLRHLDHSHDCVPLFDCRS